MTSTYWSRRTVVAAGLAASLRPVCARAAEDTDLAKAIATAVDGAIAQNGCPGAVIAVWRNGKPLFTLVRGKASLAPAIMLQADSVFRIGSLTKQFTAAALVKMASRGMLTLDDPVSRYLPAFARHPRIAICELLTHTAGLHDGVDVLPGLPSQVDLANAVATQAQVFDFPPGTAWLYSNANYIVAGAVIEAAMKRPLDVVMRDLIFAPLNLRNTTFDHDGDKVENRVSGYTPREAGKGFVPAVPVPIAQAGGAGAMRSTAYDLCAWHHALFHYRLFDTAYVEMMLSPGRLRDGRLAGANRFSAQDAVYGDTQYGLGLLLPPPVRGHMDVLHYGYINGFSACLESWPDLDTSLAVLCNADVNAALPTRVIRRLVATKLVV